MNLEGLHPHQAEHVPWLLERCHGMLAWDMGVGKTATLIRAWELSQKGPLLVFCLNTAKENWRREIENFALDQDWRPRVVVAGTFAKVGRAAKTADVVIVNYEKVLTIDWPPFLRSRKWGVLVLDEAHKLKNPEAQTTKAIYGKPKSHAPSIIDSAEYIWLATGTPMPNHPGELYSHSVALWPECIQYKDRTMNRWEFETTYCETEQTQFGLKIIGGRNLKQLRESLMPVVSVLKRNILKLPPLNISTWALSGDQGTKKIMIPGMLGTLEKRYGTFRDIDKFDSKTLDAYLECIKSALEPLPTVRRETAQLKAVFVAALVAEEIEAGHGEKTVIFAIHREAIRTLEESFKKFGIGTAVIHGDVPERFRQSIIDRFQNDPSCKIFIGQLNVAGSSINLQSAAKVIFVEMSWTPGDNEQAMGRVYRMGQTQPVFVRFVYLPDSVDEAVTRANRRKMAIISEVFK
jgi:SNF2 family DNA or RNA helicase